MASLQTIQVKATEKFGEQAKVGTYAKSIFDVYICEYWQGKFWQIARDLPNPPIFPYQSFPCMVHHCTT